MALTVYRDYSLTGANSNSKFENDQWYSSPISRKRLKELMQRSDKAALKNYGLWLGLVIIFAILLVLTWGSVWALPTAIFYGVLYGSGGDSRWHETGHGTAFKTRWLNDVFYQLSSFMSLRNPNLWRWSHTRHHSETVIVGRDPEIAFPRPPSLRDWVLNLLYIPTIAKELAKMVRLSFGHLNDAEKQYLPQSEWSKTYWVSRIQLGVLIAIAGTSFILSSWLPLMLVGLPTFYGSWLHHIMATTQHAGLAEDVPDHRMNSRTVYLNPFLRFIYSNMNYHVEHHMFPLVPFYNLPALHDEIKEDCPPAYSSLLACYREMVPAVVRQQEDPNYFVKRPLPDQAGATPFYQRPIIAAE